MASWLETPDEAQARAWWTQDFNIACNAGVIIDVDSGIADAIWAERMAKIWGLPPTFTVHTGGRDAFGVQFHFKGDAPGQQGPYENINGCRGEVRTLQGNQYGLFPWLNSS